MDTTLNGYTTEHTTVTTTTPVNNKNVPVSADSPNPSRTTERHQETPQTPRGPALTALLSTPPHNLISSSTTTPKKCTYDTDSHKKIFSPGGCEIQPLDVNKETCDINVLKGRFLLSPESPPPTTDARTSYKHFVDLHSSTYRCIDIYTREIFKLKIVNEPLPKVQMAYFNLIQDNCNSDIYGHQLVRSVRDLIPMSSGRTYVIVANSETVYEDLHSYVRSKRRLDENEARALFHQICQTVQVCHRNGIILRDLKLKRFHFIDEARTKIQYESLEGSMILDDPANDTLCDKIGCPLYTAPELLCPNSTYAGKPADMWSLGVLLYTMLVGQYPFYEKGGNNLITVIRQCCVHIPMELSRQVRWLLRSLLRRAPEERMKAKHILYHPWLEKQKPFYMSISVDAVFSDTDDEDESSDNMDAKSTNDTDTEPKSAKRPRLDSVEHSNTSITTTTLTTNNSHVVGDSVEKSYNKIIDLGGL